MESLGQKVDIWTDEWKGLSIESEIRMWDYFGGRHWILKYTPRKGKVLEAGCGLGRYNFYLSKLGINIIGLDFSSETIEKLKYWGKQNEFNNEFVVGDVKKLPFENDSLSGYLSFGVVEHFIEGPSAPIKEAFRVLRPGGIAIITTPNKSWNIRKNKIKRKIKDSVKKIIGRKIVKREFFQYEFNPKQLAKFVSQSGLFVTRSSGADMLYPFVEYGRFKYNNIKFNSLAYKISKMFENSWFKYFGAQSITISIKTADIMHCFFCDDMSATPDSLKSFDVPTCANCQELDNALHYKRNSTTKYHNKYIIEREIIKPEERNCDFCEIVYTTDFLFEDFGFSKNICPKCLNKNELNIEISNKYIQPIWRKRKTSHLN